MEPRGLVQRRGMLAGGARAGAGCLELLPVLPGVSPGPGGAAGWDPRRAAGSWLCTAGAHSAAEPGGGGGAQPGPAPGPSAGLGQPRRRAWCPGRPLCSLM